LERLEKEMGEKVVSVRRTEREVEGKKIGRKKCEPIRQVHRREVGPETIEYEVFRKG